MERIFGNSSTPNAANWRPEPRERGTYSILSTCIITLGLCVWTAVHLNVPAHRGHWQQIGRKFGWMILGFLAPELVAFAAFKQYTVARNITKKMNKTIEGRKPDVETPEDAPSGKTAGSNTKDTPEDASENTPEGNLGDTPGDTSGEVRPNNKKGRGWTIVHSYFAAMGGFALEIKDHRRNLFPAWGSRKDRPARLAITEEGLLFLEEHRPELIPDLPRARIEDKSKGSMLAKLLVCFQALWFCVQCLSRFAQRLPISLLELNTFGHAFCTLLIYCMWWEKPLDIEEPELIPVQGEDMEKLVAAMCVSSEVDIDPQPINPWERDVDSRLLAFAVKWDPVRKEGHLISKRRSPSLLDRIARLFAWLSIFSSANPENTVLTATAPVDATHSISPGDFFPGGQPKPHVSIPYLDLWRWTLAVQVREHVPRNTLAERVRNFPRLDELDGQWPLYLAFGIIGLVYGGLHCLAWNAPFATDLERLFWRASSVAVASTGVLIALAFTWTISPAFWVDWITAFGSIYDLLTNAFLKLGLYSVFDKMFRSDYKEDKISTGTILVGLVEFTCRGPLTVLKALFDIAVAASVILYALARVYLLVECFINLAHLPDGAYQVPQWSQYVPHIA
ncbi:uncharacterized protein DNG_03918 [Cephalotrichum gorgonifer]|uniref:Uncharacterized protein n=1 Tax=Cephalotrichum gorgonifer TaxID=2041049 RepID=A0AAE8SU28_9PEZI|nr:uncharacterized protein DNG_03918 [Cephalotrichum gorgonifer]